ncbi:MAG: type VI secretion system protein TssA [Rhodocyclaceae bacterium]|nr:type VI secretion system protein TssA [Rhodocyclaceae bacterium]MBX3668288.1 type VI secretion system protein TssA [Rhodocyclaceae bacterium]
MDDSLQTRADQFYSAATGHGLDALLAPFATPARAGESLRHGAEYRAIQEARREDDDSLPQGIWQHELKRADWDGSLRLCADLIATRSKDLQIAAWLLEASLHRHGFAALAPGLVLVHGLCRDFWDDLHPAGDHELHGNIFRWMNARLLPPLRQVSITAAGGNREFGWADWELAHRREQQRAVAGQRSPSDGEIVPAEIAAALALTPGEICIERHAQIATALAALEQLKALLEQRFSKDGPSLGALATLLEDMGDWLAAELAKRGRGPAAAAPAAAAEAPALQGGNSLDQAIADRAEAYRHLAAAAEFLMRLEPHSPVPYLVRRAIDWGRLNTVELYQELFVRMGGQISIFDLLGLDAGRQS